MVNAKWQLILENGGIKTTYMTGQISFFLSGRHFETAIFKKYSFSVYIGFYLLVL